MIGRLRKLVNKTKNAGITNIKLLRTEARALVCLSLPHKSIDRVHILCPDPWPKHKHKGERLMSSEFIYRLSLVLKDNGVLHFSTDDTRYFKATCDLVGMTDFFAPDSDPPRRRCRGYENRLRKEVEPTRARSQQGGMEKSQKRVTKIRPCLLKSNVQPDWLAALKRRLRLPLLSKERNQKRI